MAASLDVDLQVVILMYSCLLNIYMYKDTFCAVDFWSWRREILSFANYLISSSVLNLMLF